MRRYISLVTGLAFVLFAVLAVAQAYPSGQSNPSSSQASTSQTPSSTTSGSQKTVEGCVFKEQSDYFLVPKNGNPIRLQAGTENLSTHEGHKVKISGSETAISAASGAGSSGGMAGTAAGTSSTTSQTNPSSSTIGSSTGSSQTGATGSATGTGDELHKLATQELTISNVQHEADTCPANWNSKVRTPSTSGVK